MSWSRKLLESPKKPVLIALTVVGALGVLLIGRQMPVRGGDILALEFVWTPEQALALLDAWGPLKYDAARMSVWVDFPFIAAYATLLMGLVLLAARASRGGLQRLGLGLALVPWLAGLLDVVENLCLLRILDGPADPPGPLVTMLAGTCATAKFLGVIACAGYVLVATGAWALGLVRGR
ncbi:hypothetical protein HPC49_52400 [Pyxidicoccus fallax]|uniref:Uncharacterized protein n=1 Tax=Pyxidicoccus fallax TaxID=394095 RepID=A0A848LLH7_9BACT|nr:hypothetical protein [Pyxidicoccus fallax]NMO18532.1 hypothetical protein [Pyxidicoccus fallax]NPC86775.1 hypothetical protein [Pyxidicoccus fallax]